MIHTIVVEIPDGANPNEVESNVTRRIEMMAISTGTDNDGLRNYSNPLVIEYHHEKMTEDVSEWGKDWQ